jgi:AraC-like DNA-binding protein
MIYKIYKPRKELMPYINCFWVLETNAGDMFNSPLKTIPHGLTELLCVYDGKGEVKAGDVAFEIKPDIYFRGQLAGHTLFDNFEKIGVITCQFSAIGASKIFSLPISVFQNQMVDIQSILGSSAIHWFNTLSGMECDMERIGFLEDKFLELIRKSTKLADKVVLSSIKEIEAVNGALFVKELSSKFLLSEKQFERRFLSTIGITPKKYARIVRFKSILNSINQKPIDNLTTLSYNHNFSDQAHFIKEFKTFTGLTPKEYQRNKEMQSLCFASKPNAVS